MQNISISYNKMEMSNFLVNGHSPSDKVSGKSENSIQLVEDVTDSELYMIAAGSLLIIFFIWILCCIARKTRKAKKNKAKVLLEPE